MSRRISNNRNLPQRRNQSALHQQVKQMQNLDNDEAVRTGGPFDPPTTVMTPTFFVKIRIPSNLATPTEVTPNYIRPFLPGLPTEIRLIKVSLYGPTSVVSSDLPLVCNTDGSTVGGAVFPGPIFCDRGNLNHRAVIHWRPARIVRQTWFESTSTNVLFTVSIPGATSTGTYTSLIDISAEIRPVAGSSNTF